MTRLLVLLCCAPIFFCLGDGELQSWDEGLYALRAEAVLDHGHILDQTRWSPGGLYSSTQPPLSVWGMSAGMTIFGRNLWGVRMFSALCGAGGVILMFLIARARLGEWGGVLAAALLSGALSWQIYAHFGMTDVPLMFFCLLALWAALRLHEADDRTTMLRAALFFTIAFAAALMTKIVVSLLPLLFALIFCLSPGAKPEVRRYLLFASLAALMLAAPWYGYMWLRYGAEFYGALAPPHVFGMAEGGPALRGWWYYANRLLVDVPLLAGAALALRIGGRGKTSARHPLEALSAMWFVLSFIVFSFAQTKMPHYALLMLPPLVFGAALFIVGIVRNTKPLPIAVRIALASIPALLAWSLAPRWRAGYAQILRANPEMLVWPALLIALGIVIFVGAKLPRFAARSAVILAAAAALCLYARAFAYNLATEGRQVDGAARTADALENGGADSLLVLVHARNEGDLLVPQLAWYTRGWALNQRAGKFAEVRGLNEWRFDRELLAQAEAAQPDAQLVYHFSPAYGRAYDSTRTYLTQRRPLLLETRRYLLFGAARAAADRVDSFQTHIDIGHEDSTGFAR